MTNPTPGATGADMRPLLPPVRDQGQRGTCLAFAVTGAHEVDRAAGVPVAEHLSEEALYWGCKLVDGNWASGTRFTSAAVAIGGTGQPIEALWPYDPHRAEGVRFDPPAKPTSDWYTSGLAKSGAPDLAGLRAELDGGRPVLLGLTVFDTFFAPDATGHIHAPPAGSPPRGRHAVLSVGHQPAEFLIRNSWGDTWALAGYAWIGEDYVERHAADAWIIDVGRTASTTTTALKTATQGDTYGSR